MTTGSIGGGGVNRDRPAMSGRLGTDYEVQFGGGGSGPRDFVPPSEVRRVFDRGFNLLGERLEAVSRQHNVQATVAMVKLRSEAASKSHRHPSLFDRHRFQVAGVQSPGEILALVTRDSLTGLSELVEGASQRQLAYLSAVAEISPYAPPISRGEERSVVTLFDGLLDDDSSLREQGLKNLADNGADLQPYGKALNAYVTSFLPPDASLRDMPWLRGVRPVGKVLTAVTPGSRHFPMNLNYSGHDQTLPLPIVGIVDSGIDSSIPWLKRLIASRESIVPPTYTDTGHGSLVGSLAATSGGFTGDPNLYPNPIARLLDVQVVGTGSYLGIDEDVLLSQIESAVQKYGPQATTRPAGADESVVVWNLSLNTDTKGCDEDLFSLFATELDRISSENKVIFTISAGNFRDLPLRRWISGNGPHPLTNGEDRICPPADSAINISVGSLSHTSNSPTAAPAEHPSPFSRRGPGPGLLIKPDVVHYGGTCGTLGEHVPGILGPHKNGVALENTGTSFAAPQVAGQLASLVSILPDPEPELLKLILYLSCTNTGDHDLQERRLVNYYGFGFPESPSRILSCEPWECTIFLRGEIRPGWHLRAPFPFPPSLEEQGALRGQVRMVLVYSPVLDSTKGSEYFQTNVTASLGRMKATTNSAQLRFKREIHQVPRVHGISTTREQDLFKHSWQWSPTKFYERAFSKLEVKAGDGGWRLGVDFLLRRELEDRQEEIRQPFWLGIRIVDPDKRSPVYQEVRQQVQQMALAQPILLRPQIPT